MHRFLKASLFGTIAFVTSGALAPSVASADDKQACLASSEHAQRLRMDGKLSDARKELLVCSRELCPAVVRSDCAVWLNEVTALMPSIVIDARDDKGNDITNAVVFLDGQKFMDKVDGKAVVVPTGEHVIRLEHEGSDPVEQKVLIREGEKARQIDFKFITPGGAKIGAPPPSPPATTGGGHTIPPWVVFGVGMAAATTGVILYFVGRGGVPSNCDFGDRTCTPTSSEALLLKSSDPTAGTTAVNNDEQNAASATGTANLGIVIGIVGGVVAVGGIVWHFVEPTGPSKAGSNGDPANTTDSSKTKVGLQNFFPVITPHFTGAGFSTAF